jgi:hypothetical protein
VSWLGRLFGGGKPAPVGERTQTMPRPVVRHEATVAAGYQAQDGVARMAGVIQASLQAQKRGARGFLHVYAGKSQGQNVLLTSKTVRIGRTEGENDLVLSDNGVSSRHCEIRPSEGGFAIVDGGSRNGTFVNDQKVGEKPLQHGDLIAFGDTRIYVGIVSASSGRAAAEEGALPGDAKVDAFKRRWMKPMLTLSFGSVAIFAVLYLIDHYVTGGAGEATSQNPFARFFIFDSGSVGGPTGALAGLMAAILGLVITVVSIVVQLAAGRYSGIAAMFLKDRTNLMVLGFYVTACIVGVWLSFAVRADFAPRLTVLAMMLVVTGGLSLMGPYFAYVFWFVEPENIIARFRDGAVSTVHEAQKAKEEEAASALQVDLVGTIEEFTDFAGGSIAERDKVIASRTVDALKDFALDYITLKSDLPPAWFTVGAGLQQNPAFVALDPESRYDIEKRRTWVEWKIMRQLLGIYNEGLASMKDITYLLAIDTRYIGEAAAFADDHETVVLTVSCFNSYLRATLNAKDVRTVYNVMNQYRLFVEALMRLKRVDEALVAAGHMKYYGVVGYDLKISFVTETVAYDLASLCQVASQVGFAGEEKLLRLLLDLDRPGAGQDPALAGVRKAQAKLAAFYTLHGKKERAEMIRQDISLEPIMRLKSIRDELLRVDTKDFWEFIDRGRNFEFMPSEQREALKKFFAWVDEAKVVEAPRTVASAYK